MSDDPLYRSANGDDWLLRTDAATAQISVVHRPNPRSGGVENVTPVDELLERSGSSPEAEAVRHALAKARS